MEPAGKRRKLAPKLHASSASPTSDSHPQYHLPHPSHIVPDAPRHSQRQEFEAFARHLHDAANLINRQSEQQSPRYSAVSVLLLSWQDDGSVDDNIRSLRHCLETEYRFKTQLWQIPTVAHPSIKLGVQMASFLEHARPDELIIIYYSGHGFVGHDGQLYWACSPSDHSVRLKWDSVRCLLEDAQSDMLLILDTCAVPDTITSSHAVKHIIAAQFPDHNQQMTPAETKYFTPCLTAALRKLYSAPSFTTQALCDEIRNIAHENVQSSPGLPSPGPGPKFLSLTPDKGRTIELAPLTTPSNTTTPTGTHASPRNPPSNLASDAKLTFDEARVLVCTTFVGDASPDMSAFNSWLQKSPPLAAQVTVEGMFLGPPTVLLISMPTSLWNNVQHDKIWFYLGSVTSRNMASLYGNMVAQQQQQQPPQPPPQPPPPQPQQPQQPQQPRGTDGSIASLCAPEPPPHTSLSRQNSFSQRPPTAHTPTDGQTSPTARLYQSLAAGGLGMKPKTEGADSAEMQEAAEQLKALSHVRHRSGDAGDHSSRGPLPDAMPSLHPGFRSFGRSESMPVLQSGSRPAGPRPRRIMGKPVIRCAHCSHAPFKDSSSLRKHIAAAHTRPFPCAFHFGGCTSTFGSKNEWKRHIASQHLCLQFYRCSVCARTAADGKGSEFNRKDLFTQHLRRMHAPPQVKRALAKGEEGAPQSDWDNYVKEMQLSCLIQRRLPPQRSNCPKPGCTSGFEGPTAWDEWTEHVGRHMEKGEGDNLGVDSLLRQYALDEGIIERTGENQYRLCPLLVAPGPSQPGSQPIDLNDSQPMSSQSTLAPLDDSQPWGRSLPPLPPLHSSDRNPSQ